MFGFFALTYLIITLFIPLAIAIKRNQSAGVVCFIFILSLVLTPILLFKTIMDGAFGNADYVVLALFFASLPYFVAIISWDKPAPGWLGDEGIVTKGSYNDQVEEQDKTKR